MQIPGALLKRIALGLTVVAGSSGCTDSIENDPSTDSEKNTTIQTDSSECIPLQNQDSLDAPLQSTDSITGTGIDHGIISPEYCPPCGMG